MEFGRRKKVDYAIWADIQMILRSLWGGCGEEALGVVMLCVLVGCDCTHVCGCNSVS